MCRGTKKKKSKGQKAAICHPSTKVVYSFLTTLKELVCIFPHIYFGMKKKQRRLDLIGFLICFYEISSILREKTGQDDIVYNGTIRYCRSNKKE